MDLDILGGGSQLVPSPPLLSFLLLYFWGFSTLFLCLLPLPLVPGVGRRLLVASILGIFTPPPSTPVMPGPTVNQMPPEHTKDVWRAGLASPGEGVQWARGRERPSLEPWAPVSSWAAGRTLGHGCPSWTLLCHLVAVICNCGRPRTARGADPVGRFQVCEADRGSPAYPSLGSIARTPPAADRGCVALLWPGWSPLPLDGGQGLSCPRG